MAYTQTDLDDLRAARKKLLTGKMVESVTVLGETIQYTRADLGRLKEFIDEVETELSLSNPDSDAATSFVVHGGKGL